MESTWVKSLYHDEFGASAVEYSILLACIAIGIVSAVVIFGSSVNELFVKGNGIFE